MSRYAVFVDAGSLLSGVAEEIANEQVRRSIRIEPVGFVSELIKWSNETIPQSLLRLYWFDGAIDQATKTHRAIAEMNNVKLRLGRVVNGSQKGVDALVYGDLIELVEHRAVDTVLLIASDGDFTEAVERCQQRGLRVELAAINPQAKAISYDLRTAVDAVHHIPIDRLRQYVTLAPPSDSAITQSVASNKKAKAALMAQPSNEIREKEAEAELVALASSLAVTVRDALTAETSVEMMNRFPAIDKHHHGEMMTKASSIVGGRLGTVAQDLLRRTWRASYKARHEELKP